MRMDQDQDHGHATAGAIGRYYRLRERLRCLYRAEQPDTAAIDAVLVELDATHRYFKQMACSSTAASPH